METLDFHTVDKTTWSEGPWQNEPDKRQWRDPATGLACLIVRSPVTGALCGYVGVPASHPAHGMPVANPETRTIARSIEAMDVHGGLSIGCPPGAAESETPLHWLGFNCMHVGDLMPAPPFHFMRRYGGQEYRDVGYVRQECTALAAQLAALAAAVETGAPACRQQGTR